MANNVTITGIKAGTTTITASYTDGGVTQTSSVNFTVSKTTGYLTATTSNKTYNGSAQTIATIATNSGTYYFGLGSSTTSGPSSWGTANTALQATNAGTYYVWAKCDTSTNYEAVGAKYIGTVTISQRTVTVTAPTVQSNTIRYTGSAQALLSGNGSVSAGGTMYYYCSTSSTAPTTFSTSTWSTTAPSKTDVGTYYIWYYAYVSDTSNNTGTNINTVKSLGSKAIEKRIGTAPTFNASSVTATCVQSAAAVNAGAFTAATAGHSGTITYSIQGVVKNGTSTQLSGWTMTSTTSRVITVPASTKPGTYKVTVRATEATTSTDTSSSTDAVITVTLGLGTQSLTLTSNPTNATITYPNTGTITASGHAGTISASSGTTSVATVSVSGDVVTVTSKGQGTSVITVTAAATDYVDSVSKTVTWTVNRRTGAAPTFAASSVSATIIATTHDAVNAGAFTAATAGHSGSITYSIQGVVKDGTSTQLTGWTMTSTTSRVITVPASTKSGTYKVTVRASEAQTSTDTSSYKDAVITVTLNKATQPLTLDKTTLSLTVPNTGTIKASNYLGSLTVSSNTTGVATCTNSAGTAPYTTTITAVSAGSASNTTGTATITFTAAATDYEDSVSKTATVTVSKRTGAAPTFNNASVTATCIQAGSAVNAGAFTAATARHSGSITYSIQGVVKSGTSTQLSGWTMTSTTSRVITVPASTLPGTYLVTVRATESATATDTSSTKDATITVTLGKGSQTLTLNKTELALIVPNTGTITASGYAGTLSVSSSNTNVATASNAATSTITAIGAGSASNTTGTATITFTAAATDYVNAVSKTATVTVSKRTGAAPTFNNASVTATCIQAQSARTTSAFTAATAGHSGSISYSLVSAKNSGGTSLSGWSVSGDNRTIGIPANTVSGTYTVVVRATESATATDTSSTKDATITVTLSKGSQTLTLNKTELPLTVGGTPGTITASGYVGTLTVSSGTPAVATATNEATSTITAVKQGTSVITFTAAANNYVNEVSKTATVTVSRRTGAAPTFNASTVTATCSQDQSAKTTSAFDAATAGHSGSISYSLVSAKNSGGTSLSGWSVNSSNRTIGIPANTVSGTYTVVVRATEAQTDYDTSSTKDATITVTLSKGSQSLTLTSNPTNATSTYPNGGTITASGHAGTISASSATTGVATVTTSGSVVTVAAVKQGTSVITVTAAATDYVNSVSKTVTWTVNRRSGAAPTFNASSVTATCVQSGAAVNAGAFNTATAGHSGSITYSIQGVVKDGTSTQLSGWSLTSTTSRVITVPASTLPGTYLVTVRATEGATDYDTSSTKDATITVTLSKGTQTLTLTGNPTNYTTTYNTGGTITASGHAGTISASSGTTSVATVSVSGSVVTVTCVGAGSSSITVTAAATNYVNSVSKSVTWTINKAASTLPTTISGDSATEGNVSYHNTARATVSKDYTGGTLQYSTNGGSSWSNVTWISSTSNLTSAPSTTTLGSISVIFRVLGDANHNNSSNSSPAVTLTVYAASDARMEVDLTSRTYTTNSSGVGQSQVIASVDTTSTAVGGKYHGVASYSLGLGSSASSAPSSGTSSASLSATDAGDYYVWYKYTATAEHGGATTAWTYVGKTTISKASRSGSVQSAGNVTSMIYGNTLQMSVSCTPSYAAGGTVTWGVTNGTGKATISNTGVLTATQAGTVTVTAQVAATSNWAAYTATQKTITINKADGSISYNPTSPITVYCTSSAKAASSTEASINKGIATSSASSSTNTGVTIGYTMSVKKGSTSVSGWTIASDGKSITIPPSVAAGDYTCTIVATAPTTTNYNEVSTTKTVTINLTAVVLSSITLTVGQSTITFGGTTTAVVMAQYSNGSDPVDVTNSVSYSTNPTGIVTIS